MFNPITPTDRYGMSQNKERTILFRILRVGRVNSHTPKSHNGRFYSLIRLVHCECFYFFVRLVHYEAIGVNRLRRANASPSDLTMHCRL